MCTAKKNEPTPKEIEGCYVLCRSRGWLQQHCRAFLQLGLSSTTSASSTPNRLPGSRDGRRQAPPHQLNGRTAVRSSSRAYPGSTTYVPWPCFRWVSAYVALLVLTLQLMIVGLVSTHVAKHGFDACRRFHLQPAGQHMGRLDSNRSTHAKRWDDLVRVERQKWSYQYRMVLRIRHRVARRRRVAYLRRKLKWIQRFSRILQSGTVPGFFPGPNYFSQKYKPRDTQDTQNIRTTSETEDTQTQLRVGWISTNLARTLRNWIAWTSGEAYHPGPPPARQPTRKRRPKTQRQPVTAHVGDVSYRFHNVQGLSDKKFRDYYLAEARRQCDVLALAETNCDSDEDAREWSKGWKKASQAFWSLAPPRDGKRGGSHRGVAILLADTLGKTDAREI